MSNCNNARGRLAEKKQSVPRDREHCDYNYTESGSAHRSHHHRPSQLRKKDLCEDQMEEKNFAKIARMVCSAASAQPREICPGFHVSVQHENSETSHGKDHQAPPPHELGRMGRLLPPHAIVLRVRRRPVVAADLKIRESRKDRRGVLLAYDLILI